MADNPSDKAAADAPDRGRAGWDQVSRQDQLHWSDQRPSEDERAPVPDEKDHGHNATLAPPRDDDGLADFEASKDDDAPDTNWDQDDIRRTEFAGSRDGTNHPTHPPDVNGKPRTMLRSD